MEKYAFTLLIYTWVFMKRNDLFLEPSFGRRKFPCIAVSAERHDNR